jgi:hypothetical protein
VEALGGLRFGSLYINVAGAEALDGGHGHGFKEPERGLRIVTVQTLQ